MTMAIHFGSEAFQNQLTYDLGYEKKGLLKKNAVPTIVTQAETLTHTISITNYFNYLFFHINENVDHKLFKLLVKKTISIQKY